MTNKEKILKSALKLFAKQGIDKTSTTQIAKEVGLSNAAPFVHFKTKQDLIDSLYLKKKEDLVKEPGFVLDPEKSAKDNMFIASRAMINYFLKNYDAFVFAEMVESDPQVSKETLDVGKNIVEPMTKQMETWRKRGDIKDVDVYALQKIIWNIISVIIRQCVESKKKKADEKMLEIVWDAVKK